MIHRENLALIRTTHLFTTIGRPSFWTSKEIDVVEIPEVFHSISMWAYGPAPKCGQTADSNNGQWTIIRREVAKKVMRPCGRCFR